MRSSMLAGYVLALLALSGCVVSSQRTPAAASEDPLEYVDDLPADSPARRCVSLNDEMNDVEELLIGGDAEAMSSLFADGIDLTLFDEDYEELSSEEAAATFASFAADHDLTDLSRQHTLNTTSCLGGAFISTLEEDGLIYRVTVYVRGEEADGAHLIQRVIVDEEEDPFAD